jgi:hypothetical protein
MIISIFYVVFLLFIWFDTTAFVDYSKLFRLNKIFLINTWEEYRTINPRMDYLSFISTRKRNFITKLVSCKPCFTFWLSIISCLIFTNFLYFPVVYILSYLIYNIYVYILWKLKKS